MAELLVAEVSFSLEEPSETQVQEELVDLGLLDYCRPALESCQEARRG
jgi:hypothetical protein